MIRFCFLETLVLERLGLDVGFKKVPDDVKFSQQ